MHIYTVEYYSSIKKNEIILFTDKWMELEDIMLSEVITQVQKDKRLHVFSLSRQIQIQELSHIFIHIYTYIHPYI
jgi:hypothetical protein